MTGDVRGAGANFFSRLEQLDRANDYLKISKVQVRPVSFRVWLKDALMTRPPNLDLDLVHQTSPTLGIKFTGPTIVSAQNFEADLLRAPIYKQIVSWSYRRADLVLVNSDYQKESLLKNYGLDEKRLCKVPLVVGDDFYPADKRQSEAVRAKYGLGQQFVVAVGQSRLAEQVFTELRSRYRSKIDLVVLGKKQTSSTGIVGIRPAAKDLPALFSAATLGVFAGQECRQLLEMQKTGLPVVALSGGCRVEHGGEGVLFGLSGELSKLAFSLLADRGYRHQMGLKALKNARRSSWQKLVKETVRAYELVASKNRIRSLNFN